MQCNILVFLILMPNLRFSINHLFQYLCHLSYQKGEVVRELAMLTLRDEIVAISRTIMLYEK